MYLFAYSLLQALATSDYIVSSNSFAGEDSAFDGYRDDLGACAMRSCNKAIVNWSYPFIRLSVYPHLAIRESPKRL